MIKAIAIDLDDTLIDTSGLLVPAAAKRACELMISKGLLCSLEECVALRAQYAANLSHRELFKKIAQKILNEKSLSPKPSLIDKSSLEAQASSSDPDLLGELGAQAFYGHKEIPLPLPLLDGARLVLEQLKNKKISLFLVTAGRVETQQLKIKNAQISVFFKKIFIVDKFKNESKQDCFKKILQTEKLQPIELLSLGNRLREEIRLAKQIGATTCHFAYGEHLGETKEIAADEPDFVIQEWSALLKTCQI